MWDIFGDATSFSKYVNISVPVCTLPGRGAHRAKSSEAKRRLAGSQAPNLQPLSRRRGGSERSLRTALRAIAHAESSLVPGARSQVRPTYLPISTSDVATIHPRMRARERKSGCSDDNYRAEKSSLLSFERRKKENDQLRRCRNAVILLEYIPPNMREWTARERGKVTRLRQQRQFRQMFEQQTNVVLECMSYPSHVKSLIIRAVFSVHLCQRRRRQQQLTVPSGVSSHRRVQ